MALRLRRGTDAERLLIVPESGELIFTTDTKTVYVGDGTTTGGVPISGATALQELSDDTSPQLGNDLDLNNFNIDGTGNIDITGSITADSIIVTTFGVTNLSVDTLSSDSGSTISLNNNLNLNTNNIVGTGNINIDGTITATGNINLGDSGDDIITSTGSWSSNIVPTADATYNIGTTSTKWLNGYFNTVDTGEVLTNTITGSNSGVVFEDATSTLNIGTIYTGTIAGDDSSIFFDSTTSTTTTNTLNVNEIYNNLDELIFTSLNNTLFVDEVVGDLRGSVFADDSTTIVDSINSEITATAVTTTELDVNLIDSTTGEIDFGSINPSRVKMFWDGTGARLINYTTLAGGTSLVDHNVSRGTLDSPEALQLADGISGHAFRGYNGTEYSNASFILSFVDGDGVVSNDGVSGALVFINTNADASGLVIAEFDTHGVFRAPVLRPVPFADTTARDNQTGAVAGSIVYVTDNGQGASELQSFDGSTWHSLSDNIDVTAQSAGFILALADNYKYHRVTNAGAVNVTVPPESSVDFPIGSNITITQSGAGQVTFAPGSGVTINSADGRLSTRTQYSTATITKVGTDEWDLAGDIDNAGP